MARNTGVGSRQHRRGKLSDAQSTGKKAARQTSSPARKADSHLHRVLTYDFPQPNTIKCTEPKPSSRASRLCRTHHISQEGVPRSRSVPRAPLAADQPPSGASPPCTTLVIMRRNLHAGLLGWAHNKVARNESGVSSDDTSNSACTFIGPSILLLNSVPALPLPQPHGYRSSSLKQSRILYIQQHRVITPKEKPTGRYYTQTQAFDPTHEASTPQFPQKKKKRTHMKKQEKCT
jgi:hypothetical protein